MDLISENVKRNSFVCKVLKPKQTSHSSENSSSRFRSRNLLRSYSEDPQRALSPAAAARIRQQQGHYSSHTSLEAYAEVPSSGSATGLTMRPTDLGQQLPHSTSLQDNSSAVVADAAAAALFQHYPTHSFPRQQHRRNLSWQHGRSRCAHGQACLSLPIRTCVS